MSVEFLLFYLVLVFLVGPGMVFYGLLIVLRQRVRLTRDTVLHGRSAIIAGITTAVAGYAFSRFLWQLRDAFPH